MICCAFLLVDILRTAGNCQMSQKRGLEGDENPTYVQGKKIQRSPKYKEREDRQMEALQDTLRELANSMKELTREMREMRTEATRREEKWEKEKAELVTRIVELEKREERRDRAARKNNIRVSGVEVEDGSGLEIWLRDELNVEAKIRSAYRVGKGMVVAEVERWEKKVEIMSAKKKLKGKKIYIDNDLTREDRAVQKQLREIARIERASGKKARVAYRRIYIEGETYGWCDSEQKIKRVNGEAKNHH